MGLLKLAIGDTAMILLLHVVLLVLVLYAIYGSQKMKRDMASVKRGEKSWNHFYLAYGILSVIVTQIISLSECGKGYKVFITTVDLGALLYLAFFNGWFRNKVIGFIAASQTMEE